MQQQAMRARKGVFAGAVAAALAATLMIPSLAYADPTASEKQAEAQAALASLNSMQSTLNRTSVVYDEALAAQREAEAKRDEAQARIDEANGQIADLQTRLGSRARSMYRTGGSSFLDLLLGATTFQEFSTGWDMLNTLNENDADLVQQTKDLRAEVQEQQAAYAEQQRGGVHDVRHAGYLRQPERRSGRAAGAGARCAGSRRCSSGPSRGGSVCASGPRERERFGQCCSGQRSLAFSVARSERAFRTLLQSCDGQCYRRPGVRLHRIAIFVGWGRTELVRLLRPGKLCRDWKLLPMGNHEHVHGHVAGRRSSTWRYRHQLGPLRYLHRQRPDDPCSNLRPDGVHQPGAG